MDAGNAAWVADRRLGRRVLAVAAVAVVFVVYVAHGALPVTPFSLPLTGERHYARALAPQSWAFFTRSPRTPELVVVGRGADGSWFRLSPGHLAVPADMMGLDRVRQAEEMYIRNLRVQVPDSARSSCDGAPADCLSRLSGGRAGRTQCARARPRSAGGSCHRVGVGPEPGNSAVQLG